MSKDDLFGVSIQQYKTDIGFRTLVDGVNENGQKNRWFLWLNL